MSRLWRLQEGTFVRIPLDDGSFGYGRALVNPYMVFYDYQTPGPTSDLDVIAARPMLFAQGYRVFEKDGWTILGVRPLDGEAARPAVMFRQNIGDYTDCMIFDTAGMKRKATPEECIGIERAAIWDASHIEERLLDTFMGRPNEDEIHNRVRLEPW